MPDQFNERMENNLVVGIGDRQFIINMRMLTHIRNRQRRMLEDQMNEGKNKENIPPEDK